MHKTTMICLVFHFHRLFPPVIFSFIWNCFFFQPLYPMLRENAIKRVFKGHKIYIKNLLVPESSVREVINTLFYQFNRRMKSPPLNGTGSGSLLLLAFPCGYQSGNGALRSRLQRAFHMVWMICFLYSSLSSSTTVHISQSLFV